MRGAALLFSTLLTGCAYELGSPVPSTGELSPALVCNDQLTTTVTLTGDNLVPLPVDTLTDDPTPVIPELWLEQVSAIDGEEETSDPVHLGEVSRWLDQQTMEFDVVPELAVPEGVFDLFARNADGGMTSSREGIAAAAPPVLDAITPDLVCVEQSDEAVVLTGDGFLVVGESLPAITIGDLVLAPDATGDCFDLAGPVAGQACATLDATIPQEGLETGIYDVQVTNPETAACASTEEVRIEVVPAPVLNGVEPQLSCVDQEDRSFVLTGESFLVLADGTLPSVTFGGYTGSADSADGCTDLQGPAGGQLCEELVFTLPTGSEEPGVHAVVVTNPPPADCVSTEEVLVELVPPPVVGTLTPDPTCVAQGERPFVIEGEGFVVLADGTLPTVVIGTFVTEVEYAEECTPLTGPAGGETCTTIGFTMPEDGEEPGVHDVVVTNPAPADCSSEEPAQVEIVPPPTLSDIEPELTCLGTGEQQVALTGEGFVVLADGSLPTITIDTLSVTADSASGCTPLTGPAGGDSCTDLVATLPEDALGAGDYDVVVTNPTPADCSSEETIGIEVRDPPVLVSIEEALVCGEGGDPTFTLTGTGFLVVGGVLPTVDIGGYAAVADAATGCTTLTDSPADEECTGLTITVPETSLSTGLLSVVVTNPSPADCESSEAITVEVVAAPTVTDVDPEAACSSAPDAYTVDINGSDFLVVGSDLPTVTIGTQTFTPDAASGCTALTGSVSGEVCTTLTITVPFGTFTTTGDLTVEVTNPDPAACGSNTDISFEITDPPEITAVDPDVVCDLTETVTITGTNFVDGAEVTVGGTSASSVTFVDETTLEVVLDSGMSAGVYDVTVTNPDGCEDTMAAAIEVVDMPIVFYVDPPVVYTGLQIQATVYVSGINGDVTDVWIEEASTGTTTTLSYTYDTADPDEILAVIPDGLTEDDYHLYVEDTAACVPSLDNAFYAEDDLTVAVDSVDPPFGWTDEDTPVEVYATDPAPAGYSQFAEIPRLYLNPATPSSTTVATELNALTFQDATLLDAVVPNGLTADVYDLIVVNPDGSIGLLEDAFEVTADAPPEVDSLSPASIANNADYDITVYGSDFRTPSVTFECEDPSTGTSTSVTGTVDTASSSDTTLVVTVPSSSLTGGAVCVVTVTNSDGTWVSYSSLSVTNPSGNLYGWEVGSSLTTGRRAPAAVASRSTDASRYLYAIGGDDGTSAGALDTIERAKVGKYGDLGSWSELPDTLPEARTLAGVANIGRFVYLVGGNDGTSAVSSVLRAQVLDPREAPEIIDLGIAYGSGVELDGGTWVYRVAALFDSTYDDNPDGESRASDPYVVRLPELTDKLIVTLEWDAIAGASGYRIYRSPTADAGSGEEEWLADVTGGTTTTYTDEGDATTAGMEPLPAGALGQWHTLSSMSTEREAPCVAVGVDPSDESTWYLFAAGGRDASGTVLDDIEYLTISVVDEHDHDESGWAASAYALTSARWQCAAMVATSDLHSNVPDGTTWIYVTAGLDGTGSANKTVEAFEVGTGGDFADYYEVDSMGARAGYGYGSASNYLYVFGGSSGAPDDSGTSALICTTGTAGCNGGPPDPPDLKNWNALGISMNDPRYLPGSAQESSVFFVVGGETDTEAASTSVDFANY